jgi:branched-subunit amino acid aminotransferase/4-amino-4-deoxychorismate lyase
MNNKLTNAEEGLLPSAIGVSETLLVENGKIQFWDAHLLRLQRGIQHYVLVFFPLGIKYKN